MTNRHSVIADINAGRPIGEPPSVGGGTGGAGVGTPAPFAHGGLLTDPAIVRLQEQVATLAWLHAELAYRQMRCAAMVAALMAEKIAPQIQKTLLAQLTGMG